MGAANVYVGLKVGMTVSASIPAAVVAMLLFRTVFRQSSILEANQVQTCASAGESLAAGIIFTMPALILMGTWTEFHWGMWQAGQRFFKGAPGPENNQVVIPDKPGLGFEPDYDMLKDSLVKDPENLMEAGMLTNRDVITKA